MEHWKAKHNLEYILNDSELDESSRKAYEDDVDMQYLKAYFALLQKPTPTERPQIMFKSPVGASKDTLANTITRMLGEDKSHWYLVRP